MNFKATLYVDKVNHTLNIGYMSNTQLDIKH